MIVAARLVTDRRRSLIWWAIGMIGLVLFTVSLYPSLKDQQSVDDLMRDLPETFRTMVGYQPDIPLTSPAGFLNARLFASLAPILALVYGIGAGARAIGGAEEDGTLEALLANPVSRARVITEKYVATIGLLAALITVFTLALTALAPLFGALEGIPIARLLAACATVFTLGLLHTSLAFTIGAITGRRGPAVAITSAIAIAGYLIQSLVTSETAQALSPWHWYLDRNPLADNPDPTAIWLPIALSSTLFAIAWTVFRQRDLR